MCLQTYASRRPARYRSPITPGPCRRNLLPRLLLQPADVDEERRNSAVIDLLLCCFEHSFLVFSLFLREIDKMEVTSERPRPQMSLVLMRSLESGPLTALNCPLQPWSASTMAVSISRSSRHKHSPSAKREPLS